MRLPSLVRLLSCVLLASAPAFAATLTWTGATNSNWSTASNWDLNQSPATGDDLVFVQSGADPSNNDLAASVQLHSLTWNGATSVLALSGNSIVLQSGGSFTSNLSGAGSLDCNVGLTLNGPATITLAGTRLLTFSGSITGTGGLTLVNNSGGGSLIQLRGTNTYSGGTTVTAGLVNFASLANFGSGNITLDGGGLQWATGTTTDVSSRLNAIGGGGATFDTNANNVTLASALSGTGGVIKSGAGVLTLSGANTYTGTTSVTAGTLSVTGSTGAASTVALQTGTTIAGTGTISGSMPVGDNAIMAPGTGGIGTLSIGDMTWQGSSSGAATATFDLSNANNTSDRLAVTGFFNKGTTAGAVFKFDFGGTGNSAGNPTVYTVATFGTTTFSASDFSYTNLAAGRVGTFAIVGGNTLTFSVFSAPVINSAASASGTYGSPFSYQIFATNGPTSYSVTGTLPGGVTLNTSTGLISGTPTQSGTFNVTIGASNPAGTSTAPLAITIGKPTVTPIVTVGNKVYDGSASATITSRSLTGVNPADTANVTLTGGTATFADANVGFNKMVTVTGLALSGSAAGNYVLASSTATTTANITPASVAFTLGNLNVVYNGSPQSIVVTAIPSVGYNVTYNGSATRPTNAGTYTVGVTSTDPNYFGGASGTFTIAAVGASVSLSGLSQAFDGNPKSVTVTTTPAGLATNVTYNGSTTAPTAVGSYAVVATVTEPNYTGSASGTLQITAAPTVITQQPVSQSVNDGADVSFTVVATGAGTLRYQWLLNGTAIPGATSSTLSLTAVQLAQAGSYSVRVTSDVNTVTSSTATLTVVAVSYQGFYFGTLGSGQSEGSFALTIAGDGTGTLLLYVVSTRTGYLVPVTIDADGNFTGTGGALGAAAALEIDGQPVAAAPGDVVVTGRIANGTVTGSTSLGLALRGAAVTSGSAPAGIYSATTVGVGAPTNISVAVGGDGQTFALVTTGGITTSGTGAVGSNGAVSVTTTDGGTLTGTIGAGGTLAGTLTRGGTSTAFAGVISSTAAVRRLGNVAARGTSGAGDNAMIAGFVVGGTGPRQVLIRAVGPALSGFGVSGVLAQPVLQLFQGATVLAQNQGWGSATNATDIAAAASGAGAFAFAPNSADSALLLSLNPGSYTAVVRGVNNTTGISLVEVYEVGAAGTARLINLSTRGGVGTNDNVLIAGLVITGNMPKQVLVRAVGPTLAGFGVTGVLADPQLRVMQGATLVASNDNWSNDAAVATASAQVGAFALPGTSRDAALLVTLAPGGYTVVVSGVGNTSGVALVEVYEVP